MNFDEETPFEAFLHFLFEELRQVFSMSFEHILEDLLYFIRLGANGMDEQCLIGRIPVTMNCGFNGQQFIGFDRRDQPETRSGQWFGCNGRDAALPDCRWHFQYPLCRPFFYRTIILDVDHMRFAEIVVMRVE